MKKDYIEIGKIVGTHGVKGMVRIQPWCDEPTYFCSFKTLYITVGDVKQPLSFLNSKPHGNVVIAAINGIESMEQADTLRNRVLYAARKDMKLPKGRHFICDLLDCTVFDFKTGAKLGILCDVTKTGANDVWHIRQGEQEYLVPCIDDVVKEVDVDAGRIVIQPLDGIFN